jgi:hypothetical protein
MAAYKQLNLTGLMAYAGQILSEAQYFFDNHGRLPEIVQDLHALQANLISQLAYIEDGQGYGSVGPHSINTLKHYADIVADLLMCEPAPYPHCETYFETPRYAALVAEAREYVAGAPDVR